jgi:hypothetical protein
MQGLGLMNSAPDPVHRGAVLVPGGGDVLLLSMRRLANLVAYCMAYEFEGTVTPHLQAGSIQHWLAQPGPGTFPTALGCAAGAQLRAVLSDLQSHA